MWFIVCALILIVLIMAAATIFNRGFKSRSKTIITTCEGANPNESSPFHLRATTEENVQTTGSFPEGIAAFCGKSLKGGWDRKIVTEAFLANAWVHQDMKWTPGSVCHGCLVKWTQHHEELTV